MPTTTDTQPLEWSDLWEAMDASPDAWIPTTEDMYFEMRDCLPPRTMSGGRFLVGEPKTHNAEGKAVHACFRMTGTISDGTARFYAKHMTVSQFWEMIVEN